MWTKERVLEEYKKGFVVIWVAGAQLWITKAEWDRISPLLEDVNTYFIELQTLEGHHIFKRTRFDRAVFVTRESFLAEQLFGRFIQEAQQELLEEMQNDYSSPFADLTKNAKFLSILRGDLS